MGLLALGAAIGSPLAIAAVLLHILGHGLAKSVAVPRRRADPADHRAPARSPTVRGAGRPRTGAGRAASALGVLALLGFPPFSLFASELGIARAGFAAGLGWAHRDRSRPRPGHRRRPGRPHQPDAARPLPRHRLARRPPTRRTWRGHRAPHHDGEHRRDAGGRAHGVRGPRGQRAAPGPSAAPGRRRPDRNTMITARSSPATTARPGDHRTPHRRRGGRTPPHREHPHPRRAARPRCGAAGRRVPGRAGRRARRQPRRRRARRRRALRAVYLFTAIAPDRRVELHVPLDPDRPAGPQPGRAVVPRRPVRTRDARPVRHRPGRPPTAPPAGPPLPLAPRLVPDARRRRGPAGRSATSTARTRSAPSRARGSTRSRSARCTPA